MVHADSYCVVRDDIDTICVTADTFCVDTSVEEFTTYFYKVRSISNDCGYSLWSPAVYCTTTGGLLAPQNVQMHWNGKMRIGDLWRHKFRLSWDAVIGAYGYHGYYNTLTDGGVRSRTTDDTFLIFGALSNKRASSYGWVYAYASTDTSPSSDTAGCAVDANGREIALMQSPTIGASVSSTDAPEFRWHIPSYTSGISHYRVVIQRDGAIVYSEVISGATQNTWIPSDWSSMVSSGDHLVWTVWTVFTVGDSACPVVGDGGWHLYVDDPACFDFSGGAFTPYGATPESSYISTDT